MAMKSKYDSVNMKTFSLVLLGLTLANFPLAAANKWDIGKLDLSKLPPAADKQDLTFAKDIRPLFEASCLRCHGEQRQKGDLRLDTIEGALEGGKDGKVVIPGESKKSLLVAAAAEINNDIAMPPKHGPGGHGGPSGPGGPKGPGGPGGPGGGPPDGPGGPGRPDGPGGFGPPTKALTAEEVGLIRAWIDQGAK
jgi:Planctomycete cytochrome C